MYFMRKVFTENTHYYGILFAYLYIIQTVTKFETIQYTITDCQSVN